MQHPPFSLRSTFSSFLTFHFRRLELCVRCYTCGTGWLTKWSLCGPESHGPVCLASLMSAAARPNIVLAFSHINVAKELFLQRSLHAWITHACWFIFTKTTCTLLLHRVIALKAHGQTQKQTQKKWHTVLYIHALVTVAHRHTRRPHIVLKRGTPQSSSGLSHHTLNSVVVEKLQVLSGSALDVQPQDERWL